MVSHTEGNLTPPISYKQIKSHSLESLSIKIIGTGLFLLKLQLWHSLKSLIVWKRITWPERKSPYPFSMKNINTCCKCCHIARVVLITSSLMVKWQVKNILHSTLLNGDLVMAQVCVFCTILTPQAHKQCQNGNCEIMLGIYMILIKHHLIYSGVVSNFQI